MYLLVAMLILKHISKVEPGGKTTPILCNIRVVKDVFMYTY